MRIFLFPVSICFLIVLTTACAPTTERFFWPPPPDQPKVEFIGVYSRSIDMMSGFQRTLFGLSGGTGQGAYQPTAVVADSRGRVYASDSEFNKIVLYDFANKRIVDYLNIGLKQPFGLALDSKENLYVVERQGREVSVFNPEGYPLFSFGQKELGEPIRIAIDEERGRIYVSDRKDHQVKVFTLAGEFIQALGGEKGVRSEKDGEFNGPNDMVVDQAGILYVCDQFNARIQVFDASGTFLRKFGIRGDQLSNFEAPMGIALDRSGTIWIADIRKGALLTYSNTTDPQYLFAIYGPSDNLGPYNLRSPLDIFIDKNNRIYVPDGLAHRISVWQILDEAYLAQQPLPANWLERTDVMDLWYRDSGINPPKASEQAPAKKP